jgi:hypothetical protein
LPGRRGAFAAGVLLALACGVPGASPQQVTERFWEALREGDVEAARGYASAASAARLDEMGRARQIEAVLLGEVLTGENSAIVRTSLTTSLDDHPIQTSFDTHLVREAGEWRVDVAATERELTSAIFASSLKQIGEAVGQGVQDFSEALEESTEEVKQAIREALEELERELQ